MAVVILSQWVIGSERKSMEEEGWEVETNPMKEIQVVFARDSVWAWWQAWWHRVSVITWVCVQEWFQPRRTWHTHSKRVSGGHPRLTQGECQALTHRAWWSDKFVKRLISASLPHVSHCLSVTSPLPHDSLFPYHLNMYLCVRWTQCNLGTNPSGKHGKYKGKLSGILRVSFNVLNLDDRKHSW